MAIYGGWGIWQDYRDVGHFDLGRSIGVATDRWVDLPRDVARVSTGAFGILNSTSTDDGTQSTGAEPQAQELLEEVSSEIKEADTGLPSTGLRRLSGQENDPFFVEDPSSQNSESAPVAASAQEAVPIGSAVGINPQSQPQSGGSSTTSSGALDGATVWDSNTNQNITLNRSEYTEFQSTQKVPNSPLTGNQSNGTTSPVTNLPTSATSGLGRYRDHMLELINEARGHDGLRPVELGANPAAQQHAEAMLKHNFVGHWGINGLTPEMRYTLAGGSGYLAENVANFKQQPFIVYPSAHPLEALLETHNDFMENPDHRENILNPWHTHVNLGIACNHVSCAVAQDFERNFIAFSGLPAIFDGVLTFSGALKDPLAFAAIEVWYHEPPRPLTLGQLDATYTYNSGQEPATFLLNPPSPGDFYSEEQLQPTRLDWQSYADPYKIDPDSPRDFKHPEPPANLNSRSRMVPLTIARIWQNEDSYFKVEANLTTVVEEMGAGVYTVYIWGSEGSNKVPLTNYSIFVE